jgi:hypothetical protein
VPESIQAWATFAAALIAAGALILSLKNFLALRHHQEAMRGYERRSTDLAERMLAVEQARDDRARVASEQADVRASYRRPHVIVTNHGQAPATAIRLLLDDVPWSEHEQVMSGGSGPEHLAPGGTWEGRLIPSPMIPDPTKITVFFTDTHGEREWSSTIG